MARTRMAETGNQSIDPPPMALTMGGMPRIG